MNNLYQNRTHKEDSFFGMNEKSTFMMLFLMLALVLVLLPFVTTLNETLTKILERNQLYFWIQSHIVPFEMKLMGAALIPLGYDFMAYTNGFTINGVPIGITWNCIGWQSLLLLLVTFIIGFQGRYTKSSIIEVVLIGLLGTFFINLFRMIFTSLLAVHSPSVFAIVFHDYFAALITIIWLCVFWWFSYSFVLEHKRES